MQILPREQSFGALLGSGLGQLAGHKIGQLLKTHQQQQERSEFAKTWEPYLGKQTANFLSNLGPEERRNALGNLEQLTGAFQQPEQQNGLAALNQQNQQQGQQQQANPQDQISQALQQYFNNPTLGNQQQIPQFGQQAPQQQMGQQQGQEQGLTPERAKLIEGIFETPERRKEKREQQKLELVQRQAQNKEKEFNLKETKKYVEDLKVKEKASKEADLRLKRMETLIDKGKLPNAAIWSFLTKVENAPYIGGLTALLADPVKSWIKSGNPDIEEFEKLSNDFVKNAKPYFGSRLTDKDLEIYMQTIPTLLQTDSGKKKVIQNLRSLNELTEIEAKAVRSIIRENGGIPPLDIEQQVQDKIGSKLDKVAKKFIVRE
jgi:hypothetical protein